MFKQKGAVKINFNLKKGRIPKILYTSFSEKKPLIFNRDFVLHFILFLKKSKKQPLQIICH